MSTKTSNFEYTKPGVDEFYDVTEYNQTLDQIDADIQARKEAEELKAASGVYGHVKLSDSSAVTDSTGLALPATEKNASIDGTLANQIANIRGLDLIWYNTGSNFNMTDSYSENQNVAVPEKYDAFMIFFNSGAVCCIRNTVGAEITTTHDSRRNCSTGRSSINFNISSRIAGDQGGLKHGERYHSITPGFTGRSSKVERNL